MESSKAGGYWTHVRRPIYALALVIPMTLVYELGLSTTRVKVGAEHIQIRNAADMFLQLLVRKLGLTGFLITGAIIIATLLLWQLTRGESWHLKTGYVVGMVFESLAYALVLIFIFVWTGNVLANTSGAPELTLTGQLVLSVGAGVYEEFVFRLLLIWTLSFLLQLATGTSSEGAWMLAAVVSAVVFALAHHVGPLGEAFTWLNFLLRVIAGLFFAALLALRGFGIAAASHALYDVLVVLLKSST